MLRSILEYIRHGMINIISYLAVLLLGLPMLILHFLDEHRWLLVAVLPCISFSLWYALWTTVLTLVGFVVWFIVFILIALFNEDDERGTLDGY